MIFAKGGSADSSSTRGFTLLEVLIAITIFAVSVSVVYTLYGAILSVVHSAEDRTAQNSRVQVTFERFSADLAGLYQAKQGFLVGKTADNSADEAILEFVSTSHLSFDPEAPPVALALIRYYLRQDDQGRTYSLLRSDSPVSIGAEDDGFAEKIKLVLCEGLKEIKLNYVDRESQEFDEWDSLSLAEENGEDQEDPRRFPVQVGIELVFSGNADGGSERFATAIRVRPALFGGGEGRDVR